MYLKVILRYLEMGYIIKSMPSNSASKMFFYTYVLISLKDGRFYMGYTNDLRRRMEEHNSGKSFNV